MEQRNPADTSLGRPLDGWRLRLYTIIFEADTRAGRSFDIVLIIAILLSVLFVMLGSVATINAKYSAVFSWVEIGFTALFTLEYVARLACVKYPMRYALSFFGIVDLLAMLPSYLALFFPEVYVLVDVRVLRLLRIFRIFKLTAYLTEFTTLGLALRASARKILVFLSVVLMVVVIMGTVMYAVEGPAHGYTSIPASIYWAITTMTTVGFGDITPKTDLGRFIASTMMLMGWGVLAVPTGIVTAEMTAQRRHFMSTPTTRTCQECLSEGHAADANFCQHCGARLPAYQSEAAAKIS
ncbi:ion transporter [Undibacterium macrobrachii]|jgi:voltage-gated potassium channel|uniref:Ion transporter n=1 Tax=Undibacterium macrobrachii TaxID=1119058 RepID=A0ABQ2XD80_9BURK|nr:ion transporter [Undibacterium macrobrachii]GGX10112.1 ion transporter [Undibacterium macrobrachii]